MSVQIRSKFLAIAGKLKWNKANITCWYLLVKLTFSACGDDLN